MGNGTWMHRMDRIWNGLSLRARRDAKKCMQSPATTLAGFEEGFLKLNSGFLTLVAIHGSLETHSIPNIKV